MPIRVSKLLNQYVRPQDVEAAGPQATAQMPPHMLSFTKDPKPVVTWNCTRRCNLRCVHCYSDSTNTLYEGELTTREAKRMIDDLAEYGVPILLFSGGEPLLRGDIFELMQYAKHHGIRPTLSTNGTTITEQIAGRLKDLGVGYAGISMDGIGATNDAFRGVDGAFDRMVRGIHNCQKVGQKVSLRFTITAHNHRDLPQIFDFIEEHGIDRACFYHLVHAGRGDALDDGVMTPEQTRAVVDYIFDKAVYFHKIGEEKDILTIDNHADGVYMYLKLREQDPDRAEELHTLLRYQGGNRSGIGFADIDNLGNVHADQFSWYYSFGNVRDRPFGDIWEDTSDAVMAGYKNRRNYITGRCAHCPHFDICAGNFRARAYFATGELWASDPACYLTDEELGIQ